MKILHISPGGLEVGGVQSVIMDIVKKTPKNNHDIVLFTDEKGFHEEKFLKSGGEIFRIPIYNKNNGIRKRLDFYIRFFRIFFKVYKILRKNGKYDVIHSHNGLESAICNLAAYFAGVKIRISHSHGSNYNLHNKFSLRYVYRKLLQIIMNFSSNYKIGCTAKAFISLFGKKHLKNKKSYIVPNGIELNKYKIKQFNVLDKTSINIVHIGQYNDNKNQSFLIELLPDLIKYNKNIRLKLMGFNEEYKIKLKKLVNEFNLEPYVIFLDSNSGILALLNNADLFMFPSKNEGFGIVLLEAQAMNVPCIVSSNVPDDSNCGLCRYISLDEKKQVWINNIIVVLERKHNMKLNKDKLSKFDVNKIVSFINKIYNGFSSDDTYEYFSLK